MRWIEERTERPITEPIACATAVAISSTGTGAVEGMLVLTFVATKPEGAVVRTNTGRQTVVGNSRSIHH